MNSGKDLVKKFIGTIKECDPIHIEKYIYYFRYIHGGYRINFRHPKDILKSLFMLHNEFVNTWTHLLGSIMTLIIGIYLILNYDESKQFLIRITN